LPGRPRSLADAVRQLEADLARVRAKPSLAPRTARLLEASVGKAAKKLAEEAVEMALDAVQGDKTAVVAEAADLLYNFVVLLDRLGIGSAEVWGEMDRRREAFGLRSIEGARIYGCHPVAQKRSQPSYLVFRERPVAEGLEPARRG
jgi:phosphoribosyl-ATP pyrophosphohydrolase